MTKSIAWLRTIHDLAASNWETPSDMKRETNLPYMTCKRLLDGEVPRWHHIEALAAATSMTPTDIAALHDLHKKDLDAEAVVTKEETTVCQLSLALESPTPSSPTSSETPAPSVGSEAIGGHGSGAPETPS